jgi:disulfide bond formation protein DsbB
MAPATRPFAALVFLAGVAVLGTALLSQYWGGLMPCELCLLQRWPWAVAITLAALALLINPQGVLPWLALLLAGVFAVGVGLAFYHVGVEQHWFPGPTACTAGATTARTIEELKAQILGHQPVLCDQVQWSLFGISMAGWNLLASLAMGLYCLSAFRRARGAV